MKKTKIPFSVIRNSGNSIAIFFTETYLKIMLADYGFNTSRAYRVEKDVKNDCFIVTQSEAKNAKN